MAFSNLRVFLNKIADDIGSEDLAILKFLCGDNLTKRRLENITTPRELFVAIGERVEGEDEQLDFLRNLFQNASRFDLKHKVESVISSRKANENGTGGQYAQQNNVNNRVTGRAQSTLYSNNTGQSFACRYYPNETPAQTGTSAWVSPTMSSLMARGTQQAGNHLQSPISNFMTGTDECAHQYTQHPMGPFKSYPFKSYPAQSYPIQSYPVQSYPMQSYPHGPEEQYQPSNRNDQTLGCNPSTGSLQQQTPQPDSGGDINSGASSTLVSGSLLGSNQDQHEGRDNIDIPNQGHSNINSGETNPEGHTEQRSTMMNSADDSLGTTSTSVLGSWPGSNQAHLGGKDDKGNPNQGPLNRNSGEIDPGSSMALVPDDLTFSSQAHNAGMDNLNPGNGRADTTIMVNTTNSNQFTSSSSAEKVPVESTVSVNYDTEVAVHLHQKCPVEMSYNCFTKYFNHQNSKVLGKGGFGIVYEGTKKFHGQSVVIKEEHQSLSGLPHGGAQLQREKKVGYIKHPNLMPLYAFCEEEGKPCCLMYPKMHTDLHKALRKDSKGYQKLPLDGRLKIALHTARGLHYLHTEVKNERCVRQEIVHMDVKPGNIFLDEQFNARLGDAGMAQELPLDYSYASLSQIRGTSGYLDAFLKERHFKPVNDIFSFGIVLLELFTQNSAVERGPQNKDVTLYDKLNKKGMFSDVNKLMGLARKVVWPESADEKSFTEEFANLAIDCVKPPENRAKLSDVCKRLENLLHRKGVRKSSNPKEGAHCVSCLLNHSAKYLGVRSPNCDQRCGYFCATCLMQARRNPLECPNHGPAEPPIGGSDTYAVLVCGSDPDSPKTAAIFHQDLIGFKSVLTDSRIVGVRKDHISTITPSASRGTSQSDLVKQVLQELKQKLQGKKDVFVYFYFSGHSDHNGNLLCSSDNDCLTVDDLKNHLTLLNPHVREFLIILDCCFADGNIASEHIKDESFLVHKSLDSVNVEAPPHPLESLCSEFQEASGAESSCVIGKSPISNAEADFAESDFSTVDENVISKAPVIPSFTFRQWSSSLSQQQSYAQIRSGSFLTHYITCGLRGAHDCKFKDCKFCGKFKAQAKSLGYITASNLEDFVSKHVEEAAAKAGGRRQSPRIRSIHSKETILAFYNEEPLRDEMLFKSTSGYTERIVVDKYPLHLLDFQSMVFSKVQDHLPMCAEAKHLQILCDDEEIDSTSYVDLEDYLRQGYDIKCQLRPCNGITRGPVVVEIQTYKNQVLTLLNSLQMSRNEQQDCATFEMKTIEKSLNAEDVRECCEDSNLIDLKESFVGKSIAVILTEASVHQGVLEIRVLDQSMDCCFTKQD
ncbi:uncharacterized protein LOC111337538 isoform X3 [Stylophora pistillata]|uniref:uncharacterized protein LOC111337538 isoform X3 n=1 Tax=Stylophora pistillata TaxID=50429 RepID=UPI000C04F125|nr:uncharacterized protein LOC111337538 isoform X3 [Stylophora pistillata]